MSKYDIKKLLAKIKELEKQVEDANTLVYTILENPNQYYMKCSEYAEVYLKSRT